MEQPRPTIWAHSMTQNFLTMSDAHSHLSFIGDNDSDSTHYKRPGLMTAVAPEDQPFCGQKRKQSVIDEEHPTTAAISSEPPCKKAKRPHQSRQETSTAYWDSLSKLWLTRCALNELNRRNRPWASPVERNGDKPRQLRSLSKKLQSFAKDGGPDICSLRGVSWTKKYPGRCS